MKRRTFFKTSAIGSSAVALSALTACTTQVDKTTEVDFTSFDFNC